MKIISIAMAIGLSLGCAVAQEKTLTPSDTWGISNGVKQPTGINVLGCPWYTLVAGRVKVLCDGDPELMLDRNKNGGERGGEAGGGSQGR